MAKPLHFSVYSRPPFVLGGKKCATPKLINFCKKAHEPVYLHPPPVDNVSQFYVTELTSIKHYVCSRQYFDRSQAEINSGARPKQNDAHHKQNQYIAWGFGAGVF